MGRPASPSFHPFSPASIQNFFSISVPSSLLLLFLSAKRRRSVPFPEGSTSLLFLNVADETSLVFGSSVSQRTFFSFLWERYSAPGFFLRLDHVLLRSLDAASLF